MVLSLEKGSSVSLTKLASDSGGSLRSVTVGLGWQAAGILRSSYDLDAAAYVLNANGRLIGREWAIWYHNLRAPGDTIVHHGDDLVGGAKGDCEQITIDLEKLVTRQPRAARVVLEVVIYDAQRKRQKFGKVKNSFIRIVDDGGSELTRYDLGTEFKNVTAVTFGELVRRDGEWVFNAIGQGHDLTISGVAQKFGVHL